MTKFKLKIVTPSGIYQEVEVNQLNLRTTAGQEGILAHHMPLASGIEISEMSYIIDKQRHIFAIGGGFIYVNDDETKIIANSIESKEEIDLNRAKEAKRRAEQRIKEVTEKTDLLRAEIALKKAITRINLSLIHISEPTRQAEISYAVFCLKKKKNKKR